MTTIRPKQTACFSTGSGTLNGQQDQVEFQHVAHVRSFLNVRGIRRIEARREQAAVERSPSDGISPAISPTYSTTIARRLLKKM